jgi:hypothetical protein
MKGNKLQIIIFALLFCFLGCKKDSTITPQTTYTTTFANLLYGASTQTVIVDRILSISDSITEGVDGALVVVKSKKDTLTFIPHPDTHGIYIDTTSFLWLYPKEEYELFVYTPYGDTVEGKTVVPDTFSIVSPHDKDTIYLKNSANLTWKKSYGAEVYVVCITLENPEDTSFYKFPIEDTSISFSTISRLFQKTGWYTLEVYALDKNAFEWDLLRRTSLNRGEGVFGSMTKSTVSNYVIIK